MSVFFNGGDFSNDFDCGTFSGSEPLTTLTYLYETGNTKYNYFHINDTYIASSSGNFRNFYKVNSSTRSNIVLDTGYKILNSGDGIIYSETTGNYSVQIKTFGGATSSLGITAKNEWRPFTHTYYLDAFDPANHLLIVYNQSNQNSVDIKDYYLSKRTGFANANVLGINCNTNTASGELLSITEYTGNVRAPIINYLQANTSKQIRYIVLLYDVGIAFSGLNDALQVTRSTGVVRLDRSQSSKVYFSVVNDLTSYLYDTSQERTSINSLNNNTYSTALSNSSDFTTTPDQYVYNYSIARFAQSPVLVTHITARNPRDVSGYIDKITTRGIVSGYYLKGSGENNTYMTTESAFATGVTLFCSNSNINYVPTGLFRLSAPHISGGNLAGFEFRGSNELNPFGPGALFGYEYAYNNKVLFTGYNWYIMGTNESYNFQNILFIDNVWSDNATSSNQGTAYSWLRSGAFFSSGYENCPVGMVGHVYEPSNILNDYSYFVCWNSGLPFIEAAYRSNITSLKRWSCIGDPLLMK